MKVKDILDALSSSDIVQEIEDLIKSEGDL
ncbi:Uncharacterised protein [uncultured archaeon]|nr:Uncharacterised protein [uncultured archaeon]